MNYLQGAIMNKNLLDNLAVLQDALNEYITKDWQKNRTELDFMVANHQEMAELIDTNVTIDGKKHEMGWKWWKGASGQRTMDVVSWNKLHPAVVDNIKIELTDLVFFTLSQKILEDLTNPDDVVQLSDNDWLNFMSISANNLMQRPGMAMTLIIELAQKIDFNISAYYVAKHTLNYIRQLSGYKDGSYKKVVDGKEDNELLHDVITGITVEQMADDFENQANKIMNGVYDVFSVGIENRKDFQSWKSSVSNA
jgi:dUTP pyrophosphatase